MKNDGAQSGQAGGTRSRVVPPESLPQFIAARFALKPRRPADVVSVPATLTAAPAFARMVVNKHGLPSAAGTLRFLNSVLRDTPGGELPGLDAGMVYREPSLTSLQWFCTWFLNSVLSLTVNKLEQNFGTA